jgi:ankyrin repeat protein
MDLAPIQTAIQKGDAAQVRLLIAEDPDLISARTEQGVSLISLACYVQQPAIAAILAECGATLDIFDACAVGDEARVRVLVETFPASIDAYSPDGFYPLGLAACFGQREIVKYLLDAGADVNQSAKNALKVAPIHAAVSHGDADVVSMILERGADVNARQQNGFTALHGAAGAGRLDLIELLIQHGADLSALTDDGKSAADVAEQRGHAEAAAMLRRALV